MKSNIDILIIDYLSNSISEENAKILRNWMESNDENSRYFYDFKEIWVSTNALNAEKEFNADKAWNKFKLNNNIVSTHQFVPKNKTVSNLYKVAASIVILLSLGILLKNINSTKEPIYQNVASNNQINLQTTLPDGSLVQLNKATTLKFSSVFNDKKREVWLDGEAFFTVAKNKNKPFIVHFKNNTVTVLGTSFNIKAYKNIPSVEVFVKTGRVEFKMCESGKAILTKNEGISYNQTAKIVEKYGNDNNLYWNTKVICFENQKLKNVASELSRLFNTNIEVASEIEQIPITTTINSDKINDILNTIALTLDVQVKNDKQIHYFYK